MERPKYIINCTLQAQIHAKNFLFAHNAKSCDYFVTRKQNQCRAWVLDNKNWSVLGKVLSVVVYMYRILNIIFIGKLQKLVFPLPLLSQEKRSHQRHKMFALKMSQWHINKLYISKNKNVNVFTNSFSFGLQWNRWLRT